MKYSKGDFWEDNPEYTIVEPFNKLYKLKDKKLSSKLGNAAYLFCDYKSPFRKLSEEDRKEEILVQLDLPSTVFDIPEFKEVLAKYAEVTLTPAQQAFALWQDKIFERAKFISTQQYSEDTYDMLDKMLANSNKIWEMFIKVRKDLEAEEAEGQVRGGSAESLSDQGLI